MSERDIELLSIFESKNVKDRYRLNWLNSSEPTLTCLSDWPVVSLCLTYNLLTFNLGIQEKLGILNKGEVYSVFSYDSQQPDELSFDVNDQLTILRKGDDSEREWWWARMESHGNEGREGYVPRNLLGVRHIDIQFHSNRTVD